MDLDYAIVADGVTARPDGKLDIFGAGFDTIFAPAVPARHERLALIIRILISRHEGESPHRLDVVVQHTDGAEIARGTQPIAALTDEQRQAIPAARQAALGSVITFENLIFPEFGAYQVVISWDGNEARPPLRLFVEEPPTTMS